MLAACLAWAKAAAERKSLDGQNTQVLREELGDLLFDIRFKSMTIDSFSRIIGSYGGFFSAPEFEEIIQMIVSKDYQSEKFNSTLRNANGGACDDKFKGETFEVNRFASNNQVRHYVQAAEVTRFSVTKPIALTGFACGKIFNMNSNEKVNIPAKWNISETPGLTSPKSIILEGDILLNSDTEAYIAICCPLSLMPNKVYEITIEQATNKEYFNTCELKIKAELKNGTRVSFLADPSSGFADNKCGLVHRLQFKQT